MQKIILILNTIVAFSLLTVETLPTCHWKKGVPHCQCVAQEVMHLLRSSQDLAYEEEGMSHLDHVLQCAYFSLKEGADEECVLAALLHDLGRYWVHINSEELEGLELRDEDVEGARFLKDRGFSERVTHIVAGHIKMMRYQALVDPDGFDALPCTIHQLVAMKGGAMSKKEALSFENDPYFEDILLLHQCDVKAHMKGMKVPPLELYESLIVHHLAKQEKL